MYGRNGEQLPSAIGMRKNVNNAKMNDFYGGKDIVVSEGFTIFAAVKGMYKDIAQQPPSEKKAHTQKP